MLEHSRLSTLHQLNISVCAALHDGTLNIVKPKPSVLGVIKFVITFKWFFLMWVWFYKLFISPVFPKTCIYLPTCSSYMIEALKRHGVFKGSIMGAKRVLRCHPLAHGGVDPVSDNFKEVFRWVL